MNPFFKLIMVMALGLAIASCNKDNDALPQEPGQVTDMNNLNVPSGFGFASTRNVNLNINFKTLNDNPLKGVKFQLLDKPIELGGVVLFTGVSDQTGNFSGNFTLATQYDEVVLATFYNGIVQNQVVTVGMGNLQLTIGGSNPTALLGYEEQYPNAYANLRRGANLRTSDYTTKISYRLGTYNFDGRPNYLEPTNDFISDDFMESVNNSLPEYRPVPNFNPEYLDNQHERNIRITELSDVYVTFITEGAGYRNSLFYYVYDKNSPPQSANDVDSLIAIFPNASLGGSGGDMSPGMKVKIGRFPANKTIGFALIADGWRGGPRVTAGNWLVFSDKNLNPESNPAQKQHTVMLWDADTKRFIYGFEDIRRDFGSDNDFNDCIFYVTSNPVTAIDNDNCLRTKPTKDTDNDGVKDDNDDYPTDADRAYNNFTPTSTLAFEDLWPSLGDYDFNDLIVGYKINEVTNAANKVVEVKGKYWVKAIGASYANGFGIELNVPSATVALVTGTKIDAGSYVQNNPNGTEAGNSKASIMIFDNAFNVLPPTGPGFVNTTLNRPKSVSDTLNVTIRFTTPQLQSTLGNPPFNPFLVQNKNRGVEIHLADMEPTALANRALLGTNADKSNPTNGAYYRTSNRLPWAIQIPDDFEYAIEKVQIINAHQKFAAWATSGGTAFKDWYFNKPGYRNVGNIYR